MDHNVLLFTIVVFAIIFVLVRFMIMLIIPVTLFLFASWLFYFLVLRNKIKIFVSPGNGREDAPDYRIEGLSLKYSRMMVGTLKNIESIQGSFSYDKAIEPVITELCRKFHLLYEEALSLCKKASQIEQYLSSVNCDNLKRQAVDYQQKYNSESDFELKNECRKTVDMLKEAIITHGQGDKFIKMIDMEIERINNYFDIAKLKIANLAMSKNISASGEIEEIYKDINNLFTSIENLKHNFSQIKFK